MRLINKMLPLIGLALLVQGCFVAKQDILSDRIDREKIYTTLQNNAELIKINKEKLKKQDNAKNRLALANNYYEISDFDSALYYIAPLLAEKKSTDAFLLEAKILEAQGDLNKALQSLKIAIGINPKNAEAYNMLGVVYSKIGDYSEAKRNFLISKSLFLDDNIINNNLGMLSIITKNYHEALDYLFPLYKRGYKDNKIVANLIFALVKTGHIQEAKAMISEFHISDLPETLAKNLKQVEPAKLKNTHRH